MYEQELSQMSNENLKIETKDKIWSSTFWRNDGGNESHEQLDRCYAEWIRREGNGETYSRLHDEVRKEFT